MKTKTLIVPFALFTLISALSGAQLGQPYKGSPEFERVKSLAGTWKGTHDMGQGPLEMTVEYRIVGAGSAVAERFFAGTPMEMITMYHDKGGKLALTHYCMLHNQPGMLLKSSDKKSLAFDFDPTCGVDSQRTHMHALVITFKDDDHITQDWKLFENGKAKESHPFTLTRVKS